MTKKNQVSVSVRIKNLVSVSVSVEILVSAHLYSYDPLQWWKDNSARYPTLSKLSKRLMCTPPSSVESERLFSIGGNIYSPKRNRLTSEHGETLMFLKFNLRAFGFNY